MPDDIKAIVQRMIDANESEENIAAVIKEHTKPKPNSGLKKPITEPTSFGSGFLNSLTSGEAAGAGLKGLAGFAKGAIADIPSTLWDTAKTFQELPNPLTGGMTTMGYKMTDPEKVRDIYEGMAATPGQMWDTTKRAGSKPFEFGEMMGQVTGQPLAMEGLNIIPGATLAKGARTAGKAAKAVGETVKTHTPVSKMVPRVVSVPAMESVERGMGSGISKLADKLQQTGLPKVMRNSDYGPTPFSPKSRISPTADMKGSMSYPNLTETPELVPNSKFEPTDFSPTESLKSPTGPQKGSVSYPEMNDTPPSLMHNNQYGPTDDFVNSVMSPTGDLRGSTSFPETSMRPPDVVLNSEYGPEPFMGNGITHLADELHSMNQPPQFSDWGTSASIPNDIPNLWNTPEGPPTLSMSNPATTMPTNGTGLGQVANRLSEPAGPASMAGTSLLEPPRPPGGPPEMPPTSTNSSPFGDYKPNFDKPIITGNEPPMPREGIDYRVRYDLPKEEDWGWGANHPTEWIQKPQPKVELLPPEEKLDMFGIPTNRDMTPMEIENIKRSIMAKESQYYPDMEEFNASMDELNGIISGEVVRNELPPATEWQPPTNNDSFDLGDIGDTVDLDAPVAGEDVINPRGPEYTKRVLNYAKKGEPGFVIEPSGKDFHMVYRGPDGNPVGVAKLVKDKAGNLTVSDLAVDKGKGLLAGRAAKAIGDKLKEMKVDTSQSGYTPEGMKFKKKLSKKSS